MMEGDVLAPGAPHFQGVSSLPPAATAAAASASASSHYPNPPVTVTASAVNRNGAGAAAIMPVTELQRGQTTKSYRSNHIRSTHSNIRGISQSGASASAAAASTMNWVPAAPLPPLASNSLRGKRFVLDFTCAPNDITHSRLLALGAIIEPEVRIGVYALVTDDNSNSSRRFVAQLKMSSHNRMIKAAINAQANTAIPVDQSQSMESRVLQAERLKVPVWSRSKLNAILTEIYDTSYSGRTDLPRCNLPRIIIEDQAGKYRPTTHVFEMITTFASSHGPSPFPPRSKGEKREPVFAATPIPTYPIVDWNYRGDGSPFVSGNQRTEEQAEEWTRRRLDKQLKAQRITQATAASASAAAATAAAAAAAEQHRSKRIYCEICLESFSCSESEHFYTPLHQQLYNDPKLWEGRKRLFEEKRKLDLWVQHEAWFGSKHVSELSKEQIQEFREFMHERWANHGYFIDEETKKRFTEKQCNTISNEATTTMQEEEKESEVSANSKNEARDHLGEDAKEEHQAAVSMDVDPSPNNAEDVNLQSDPGRPTTHKHSPRPTSPQIIDLTISPVKQPSRQPTPKKPAPALRAGRITAPLASHPTDSPSPQPFLLPVNSTAPDTLSNLSPIGRRKRESKEEPTPKISGLADIDERNTPIDQHIHSPQSQFTTPKNQSGVISSKSRSNPSAAQARLLKNLQTDLIQAPGVVEGKRRNRSTSATLTRPAHTRSSSKSDDTINSPPRSRSGNMRGRQSNGNSANRSAGANAAAAISLTDSDDNDDDDDDDEKKEVIEAVKGGAQREVRQCPRNRGSATEARRDDSYTFKDSTGSPTIASKPTSANKAVDRNMCDVPDVFRNDDSAHHVAISTPLTRKKIIRPLLNCPMSIEDSQHSLPLSQSSEKERARTTSAITSAKNVVPQHPQVGGGSESISALASFEPTQRPPLTEIPHNSTATKRKAVSEKDEADADDAVDSPTKKQKANNSQPIPVHTPIHQPLVPSSRALSSHHRNTILAPSITAVESTVGLQTPLGARASSKTARQPHTKSPNQFSPVHSPSRTTLELLSTPTIDPSRNNPMAHTPLTRSNMQYPASILEGLRSPSHNSTTPLRGTQFSRFAVPMSSTVSPPVSSAFKSPPSDSIGKKLAQNHKQQRSRRPRKEQLSLDTPTQLAEESNIDRSWSSSGKKSKKVEQDDEEDAFKFDLSDTETIQASRVKEKRKKINFDTYVD